MKKLILGLTLAATSAFAGNTVLDETLFLKFQEKIQQQSSNKMAGYTLAGLSSYEQAIFVDALEILAEENSPHALDTLKSMDALTFAPLEELRLSILRIKYQTSAKLPEALVNELSTMILDPQVDVKLVYTIAAYEEIILTSGANDLIELARRHPQYKDVSDDHDFKEELSEDMFSDLVYKTPDVTEYMNGEYVKSIKLFMFCRENRLYPCLMIVKDVHGNLVRNADGTLWSNPSLASSKYGLPSYSRNGSTPTGVLTIDSVMPAADQQGAFGKFRRMVLNFIPKSKDEVLLKSLLPESSKEKDWWKESQVSRDIGRNYLRIHGTGTINKDSTTPYYPFVRTSGCVAKRENTYDGVEYKDQRLTLDAFMKAMDMTPEYKNELSIKGIFYISEINDGQDAVTLADLKALGIE